MSDYIRRKSVLIAEDELITRELLSNHLESNGFRVTQVDNGQQAVDCFIGALFNSKPFGLVFLDINMPEMDGHSALKKIRKIENLYMSKDFEKTFAFIMSAFNTFENRIAAFSQGECDSFLSKPITSNIIDQTLRNQRLMF
jgi:two-component system, chemotaxis family, chemotaxis protein CheY